MKDVIILGIESSCDETSISIVKNGYEEISFKNFAKIQYNVEDYYDLEIPIEIENELKGAKTL